ncbi:MAG: ferredoxin-NADP reductase [Elusimicrobia bacterium RIFOXYA2_FULL_39_19]|nr:MAG: ferredoxin-NADP reductase [Elusimicrobia bacterium RIFOXYA2_FULL_39_19]
MNKILEKRKLAQDTTLMVIDTQPISAKALPGQFIILRTHDNGERIPLTIVNSNPENKTITIVFQEIGKTTKLLGRLNTGEYIHDLAGPLGHASELIKYPNKIVVIGGGVGIAELLPVTIGLKNAGNSVAGIIGARNKDLLIFEDELRKTVDELHVVTDDGSKGQKGFVTDALNNIINNGGTPENISLVYAVGPVPMMRAVSVLTLNFKIKTIVSLNPIMIDGTGMCGSCRCTINGKTKFGCVDGPEFDGHSVDWNELQTRLGQFKPFEKQSLGTI